MLVNKSAAFVESSRRAALENVEPERPVIAVRHHDVTQYRAPQTLPLVLGRQIEVFDPLRVGFGADRDDTHGGGPDVDNKGMRRVKAGEEPLPDTHWIPASEALKVGTHDLGAELCNP